MKKVFLLLTTVLTMMACSTNESSSLIEGMTDVSNAKRCDCAKAGRPDCPPEKNYDWSNLETVTTTYPDRPNIVIISDGFTQSEYQTWETKAFLAATGMAYNNPNGGPQAPGTFNIYRAFMPSLNSGINVDANGGAHPETPADMTGWNPTVFNTYSGALGITRMISMYHTNRFDLQKDLIGDGTLYWDEATCSTTSGGIFERKANGDLNVYVICISNSPYYGGSGEYPTVPGATTTDTTYNTATWSQLPNTNFSVTVVGLDEEVNGGNYFKRLVQHETGHSIWGLGDLYADPQYAAGAQSYEAMFHNARTPYNLADTNLNPSGQLWNDYCDRPEYWVNYLYDCPSCTGLENQVVAACGTTPPGLVTGYPYYSGAGYTSDKWKSTPNGYSFMETIVGKWGPLEMEIMDARMRHDIGTPPNAYDAYYE